MLAIIDTQSSEGVKALQRAPGPDGESQKMRGQAGPDDIKGHEILLETSSG